jgi:hypothetical protein
MEKIKYHKDCRSNLEKMLHGTRTNTHFGLLAPELRKSLMKSGQRPLKKRSWLAEEI